MESKDTMAERRYGEQPGRDGVGGDGGVQIQKWGRHRWRCADMKIGLGHRLRRVTVF